MSAQLGGLALLIALSLGIPAGIIAATRRNTWLDYLPMSASMVGICLPTFVMGPVLALVFGLQLGWFNVAGWFTWSDRVLPALTLGLAYAAFIARLTRGGMLEILSSDFIRTARAKGASIWRHSFKEGFLIPVTEIIASKIPFILGGAVVVEQVFNWPGMGRMAWQAAQDRDFPLIMGITLLAAVFVRLGSLLQRFVHILVNPRASKE